MDAQAADPDPRILENLVAAGLVSHEMIGDPARVPTEAAALAALCARIGGPVYRLGAYHYAFRAAPGDLGEALASLEPEAWAGAFAAALTAALTGELGPDSVWIGAADLATAEEAGLDATGLLFLKAAEGATTAALAEAPGLRPVIHAGILARSVEAAAEATAAAIERAAAAAARAAGGEGAVLAATVAALSARLDALEDGIAATVKTAAETAAETAVETALEAVRRAAVGAPLERVAAGLEALGDRLRAQAAQLDEQAGRQAALASGLAALDAAIGGLAAAEAARGPALAALETRLGLTLAEFLAQVGPPGPPARTVETGHATGNATGNATGERAVARQPAAATAARFERTAS